MWAAPPTFLDDVSKAIGQSASGLLNVLGVFSAIGLVVMAIIQQLKDLTPLREAWQRVHFISWLKGRIPSADLREVEAVLINLSTSGDSKALYSLQIEQMTAQLSAATQFVLDFPTDGSVRGKASSLLAAFAPDSVADIDVVVHGPDPRWALAPAELTADDIAARQAFSDAKVRIQKHVQRSIDAIQISLGSKWQTSLQLWSSALGGLFGAMLVLSFANWSLLGTWLHALFFGIASAVLSGFLAPVTRDLVAALQGLRKT